MPHSNQDPAAPGVHDGVAPALPNADYLVLYANDAERDALRTAAAELKLGWRTIRSPATQRSYRDLGTVGYSQVLATRTAMGPHFHAGSSATALTCMAETGASTVVLVGMAYGVDRARQSGGDVIVATHLVTYDDRDVVSVDGRPRVTYPRLATQRHPAREAAVELLRRASPPPEDVDAAVLKGQACLNAARVFLRALRFEGELGVADD